MNGRSSPADEGFVLLGGGAGPPCRAGVSTARTGHHLCMSERYDHRDAETRAQDATVELETVSGSVMDGADDLRDDAEQAMADQDLDEFAEGDRR
jgi:hypothetical protein